MAERDDGRTVGALARLAGQMRREFATRMRDEAWAQEIGMRPPAYGILQVVRARRSISQRALSDVIGIDPGDMVAILDMLERAGFLVRTRDEEDRRRHNLSLTPAGATAAAQLDAIATGVTDVVLARLNGRERAVLERLLAKAAFAPRA
ncbi:MAG TPA: MarR family winged helix-turn-helix transcriptional regulator [Gaiellales bacterium]|jgi:DNA-binding MarR family transcriptional regulator